MFFIFWPFTQTANTPSSVVDSPALVHWLAGGLQHKQADLLPFTFVTGATSACFCLKLLSPGTPKIWNSLFLWWPSFKTFKNNFASTWKIQVENIESFLLSDAINHFAIDKSIQKVNFALSLSLSLSLSLVACRIPTHLLSTVCARLTTYPTD